jgi:hypothetical protein
MKKLFLLFIVASICSCSLKDDYQGYSDLIDEYEAAFRNAKIGTYDYAPYGKNKDFLESDFIIPSNLVIPLLKEYQRIDEKWDSIYIEGLKNNSDARLPNKREITFKLLLIESRHKLIKQLDSLNK